MPFKEITGKQKRIVSIEIRGARSKEEQQRLKRELLALAKKHRVKVRSKKGGKKRPR